MISQPKGRSFPLANLDPSISERVQPRQNSKTPNSATFFLVVLTSVMAPRKRKVEVVDLTGDEENHHRGQPKVHKTNKKPLASHPRQELPTPPASSQPLGTQSSNVSASQARSFSLPVHPNGYTQADRNAWLADDVEDEQDMTREIDPGGKQILTGCWLQLRPILKNYIMSSNPRSLTFCRRLRG